MARITGSSDREKRKSRSSNRPITQGQNPQRSNRQGVSKATVSTADTRNPNSVRAGLNQTNKPNGGRVTGTQGRPKPANPPKVTGGTPTNTTGPGGALVKNPSNGGTTSTRVQPVNVRDVTNQSRGQVSGTASNGSLGSAKPRPQLPAGTPQSLGSRLRSGAKGLGTVGLLAQSLYETGKAIRSVSPLDPKNQAAARRSDPKAQPLRTMTATEMRNAPRLEQYNPDKPKPKPSSPKLPTTSTTPSRPSSPVRQQSAPKASTPQVGQSSDMDANYKAWAAANPKLAAKVKPGQAGYEAINGKPAPAKETATPAKSDALKISADSGKNFRTDIALLDKKKKK